MDLRRVMAVLLCLATGGTLNARVLLLMGTVGTYYCYMQDLSALESNRSTTPSFQWIMCWEA